MCNYHVLEGPCCKMKTTVSSSSGGTLTQDSPRRPSWAHPRCPCRPSIGPTAGMLAEYIPAPRGSIRKHTTWDDDDDRRRRRGETEERDTSRRAGGRAVLGDPHTIGLTVRSLLFPPISGLDLAELGTPCFLYNVFFYMRSALVLGV